VPQAGTPQKLAGTEKWHSNVNRSVIWLAYICAWLAQKIHKLHYATAKTPPGQKSHL